MQRKKSQTRKAGEKVVCIIETDTEAHCSHDLVTATLLDFSTETSPVLFLEATRIIDWRNLRRDDVILTS